MSTFWIVLSIYLVIGFSFGGAAAWQAFIETQPDGAEEWFFCVLWMSGAIGWGLAWGVWLPIVVVLSIIDKFWTRIW